VRRALARAEDAHLVVHVIRGGSDVGQLASDIVFHNSDAAAARLEESSVHGNALSGTGVDILWAEIKRLILDRYAGLENAALTRVRHVECISSARDSVEFALGKLATDPELASEDLRNTLNYIEELAGRSNMEQVFDRIFSSFCIGK